MREVWITGYGLLSALGETGAGGGWLVALDDPARRGGLVDSNSFPPFHVHPVADFDLSTQVPRKGDQRAMGPMMQYGAYACGLAMEAAGIAGDEALLERTGLIGAAGGGERDPEVDARALDIMESGGDPGPALNRLLSDDLRPTLFLAQLPNLFGGNMSIIHKVSGATRTFMGEESAGIDALRIGFERVAAGQGDIFLIGAAFNAARPDMLIMYETGDMLLTAPLDDATRNVWTRPDAGICLGSAGAFLVVEAADHARTRGVRPLARLAAVMADRAGRRPGAAAGAAERQLASIRDRLGNGGLAVMSGVAGQGALAREEHGFLSRLRKETGCAVRGTAAVLGHTVEASFPANVILGVSCIERGRVFPALNPDPVEDGDAPETIGQVLVTGWGPLRGEGMALIERAGDGTEP